MVGTSGQKNITTQNLFLARRLQQVSSLCPVSIRAHTRNSSATRRVAYPFFPSFFLLYFLFLFVSVQSSVAVRDKSFEQPQEGVTPFFHQRNGRTS